MEVIRPSPLAIPITFLDNPTTQDSVYLENKLGEGKYNVYEVYSPTYKTSYALKVFPKSPQGITDYRAEKLTFHLNHPNVIHQVPIICHSSDFSALLTEFATYGDFFEIVTSGILATEKLIRSYFHQLVAGLDYLHSQNIAHLDLKLDNLTIGADCLLKIIDFDQAQCIQDNFTDSVGTKGFRAPELRLKTCSNLAAADIFSIGVILYACKVKQLPFKEREDPEKKDVSCYETYIEKKAEFWQTNAKLQNDDKFFSEDFIELIDGMVHQDPAKRLTLKEIKESKWYNGEAFSTEEMAAELIGPLEELKSKRKAGK